MTTPDRNTPDDRSAELDGLLFEYIDRLNAGEILDPAAIERDHPGIGASLIERLQVYRALEQPSAAPGPAGTIGDYTLRRQIGRGGMGVVYEAWQSSLDRQVALKVLPAGAAADSKAFLRFMQEAKTAARLSHPNVVGVHGMGVEQNTPYYAMEFVEGKTLAQVLAKLRAAEPETPFGKQDDARYFLNIADAFANVADGLQHAHSRKVIHRDIKPSNLILDREGRLRILDFGLARLEGQESLTLSGDVLGTPQYMSPEQAKRKKIPVDHRTDVYSLGATLYEAVTLQPPFRGKDAADTLSRIIEQDPVPLVRINARAPRDLERIVLKCLRKEPAARYGTAEALAQDLRRFVRGDAVEARAEPRWEKVVRHLKRRQRSLGLAAVLCVFLASVTWLTVKERRADYARLLAEYPPRLQEAAVELSSGELSLNPGVALEAAGISLTAGSLAPLRPEELRTLLAEAGLRPVANAAVKLQQIISELPEGRDGHYYLARAYRLLGQDRVATIELQRTLELDSDFLPAAALAQEIAAGVPGNAGWVPPQAQGTALGGWQASWLEARAAMRARRWKDARQAYDRLLAASRDREPYIGFAREAHVGRGAAHLGLREFERAAEDFAVAIFLAPESLEALLLLGKAYFLAGKKDLARATFERLDQGRIAGPRDEARLWVWAVYVSLQEYGEALGWASRIEDPSIRERLRADALLVLGEAEGALGAARAAVDLAPENLTALLLLGYALSYSVSGAAAVCERSLLDLIATTERAIQLAPMNRHVQFLQRLSQEAAYRHAATVLWRESMDAQGKVSAAIAAAALAFTSTQMARPCEIIESFADGDLWDGDPFTWQVHTPGTFAVTPEGVEIRNSTGLDAILYTAEIYSGEVTARVRGSMNGTMSVPWVIDTPCPGITVALHGRADGSFYYAVACTDGSLKLLKFRSGVRVAREFTHVGHGFEKGDLELELRVSGDHVEARAWQAGADGEGRPEDAQVIMLDNEFQAGFVAIGGYVIEGNPVLVSSVTIQTSPCGSRFRRGDTNSSGGLDLSDAVSTLGFLFLGDPAPSCLDAADADDSGDLDVTDAVFSLSYLFLGGPMPPAPYPDCGMDPTEDGLPCETVEAKC